MSDFDPNQRIEDFKEWIPVLLGPQPEGFMIFKDGTPIVKLDQTLQEAGIANGDMLVIQPSRTVALSSNATNATSTRIAGGSAPSATSIGLDFSALLGNTPAPRSTQPISFPGMTLDEAMHHNPHPQAFIQLLFSNPTMFNQLNYHRPDLADRLRGKSELEATSIWREELTKGSIRGAMAQTERRLTEENMKKKLKDDPNDPEAKVYFQKQESKKLIEVQYRNVLENYPESMGKILMLYIDCRVNGHPIQAFVDSGKVESRKPPSSIRLHMPCCRYLTLFSLYCTCRSSINHHD